MPSRRLVLVPALLAVAGLALGGCAASASDGDASVVVRVNDPGNQGPLAVAKKTGALEDAFAEVGATVEWVEGEYAFTANVPLFNAGELDVANAAFAPIAGTASKGLPVKIVSVQDREVLSEQAGIVAAPGSGIESVADLVGHRVAVNPGGKGEYLLLEALAQEGIPFDEVERVAIQPADGVAAFSAGQVDAWATFSEYFSQAAETGTVLATERSLGAVDDNVYAFRTELVEEHPEVARAFVDALQELLDEQEESPEDFVNVFEKTGPSALEGASYDRALAELQGDYSVHVPGSRDAERLQQVIDLFAEAGVVPEGLSASDFLADLG